MSKNIELGEMNINLPLIANKLDRSVNSQLTYELKRCLNSFAIDDLFFIEDLNNFVHEHLRILQALQKSYMNSQN